jgi:hypothetical protein
MASQLVWKYWLEQVHLHLLPLGDMSNNSQILGKCDFPVARLKLVMEKQNSLTLNPKASDQCSRNNKTLPQKIKPTSILNWSLKVQWQDNEFRFTHLHQAHLTNNDEVSSGEVTHHESMSIKKPPIRGWRHKGLVSQYLKVNYTEPQLTVLSCLEPLLVVGGRKEVQRTSFEIPTSGIRTWGGK